MNDPKGALTASSAIPDAALDQLVEELARLHRSSTLEFALAVGKVVLDRIYGGDLAAWRARGAKDGSFRALAAKVEALKLPGLSSTGLQRAVATLDLEDRVGVTARPQLNAAHVRAVLGLPEAQQERLLGTAEAKDWPAARLDKEAARLKQQLTSRRGRRPLPGFLKTVNGWGRLLEDESAFADLEKVAELSEEDAAAAVSTLEAMKARCEGLLAALSRGAGD